jgi:hypothetical protein
MAAEATPTPPGASRGRSQLILAGMVIVGIVFIAAMFSQLNGSGNGSGSDTSPTGGGGLALCEDDVRIGFQQPDTVAFSDVSTTGDPSSSIDASGQVSATDFDGTPVSGPWSCTTDNSSGYWTASITIDPTLS